MAELTGVNIEEDTPTTMNESSAADAHVSSSELKKINNLDELIGERGGS